LKGTEHTEYFISASPYAQAVYDLVLKDAVGVNEEKAPQGEVLARHINPISLAHVATAVAGQWKVQAGQAALCWRQR
jgi:hypothetical protein